MSKTIIRTDDLSKYNTFHLDFYKGRKPYRDYLVRPCVETYDDLVSNKLSMYTLEAAIMAFDRETPLEEIILEATLYGTPIDFVGIHVDNDDKCAFSSERCIEIIDMHKTKLEDILGKVNAPRWYVAKNKSKHRHTTLNWLVVDRYAQTADVNFIVGEYDLNAVIATFKDNETARNFAKNLNGLS